MESPPPQNHGEELFKLSKDKDTEVDKCIEYFDNLNHDEQTEALKYIDDKVMKINILQTILQFKGETIPLSFMKKLVDVGGKELIEHRNVRGSNALHYTTYYSPTNPFYLDMTKYIIDQCGIDGFKAQDNNCITPIHRYCANDSTVEGEVLRYIIEKGGMNLIGIRDKYGRNAIHMYCANSNTKDGVLKFIMEQKGGVQIMKVQDCTGNTPIHCYWKKLHTNNANNANEDASSAVEMMKLFVHDCRTEFVSIKNQHGKTPINLYYKQKKTDDSFLEAMLSAILDSINEDIVNLFDFKLSVDNVSTCKKKLARDINYLQMNEDKLQIQFVNLFSAEILDRTKYSRKAIQMLAEIKHEQLGTKISTLVHKKIQNAMNERLKFKSEPVEIMTTFPIILSSKVSSICAL